MKAILLVLIISMFGVIGFGVAGSYFERKRFFFNLLEFLKQTKSLVGFSSTKLTEILNKQSYYGDKHFKRLIKNYMSVLNDNLNISLDNLFYDITILTNEEKQDIFSFFKGLGMYDQTTQIKQIELLESKCKHYFETANEDAKKYGELYSKLGLIVGAFVALVVF